MLYHLIVVAGPNRGSIFPVQVGENWIGRQDGNAVVLQSSRISKRHCVIVCNDQGHLELKDNESANGTMVNGVPTRGKRLRVGDRVGVGDFVLQIAQPSRGKKRPPPAILDANGHPGQIGHGAVIPVDFGGGRGFPAVAGNLALAHSTHSDPLAAPAGSMTPAVPKFNVDPKGWVLHHFEKFGMPFFYNFLLRHEWRAITATLLGAFVLLNLLISVQPIMDAGRDTVIREIKQRARFMARDIADRNSAALAVHAETKTEVGSAENAYGVRVSVLSDLELRIIAPSTKLNQYLNYGVEAQFAVRARDAFRNGLETGLVAELDESTVAAIEPVMVLSAQAGRNVPVGMAVVSIDSTLSTSTMGELGVVYSETLLVTGLLAALMLMILYRLTLKPFEILGDDLDKALKGDLPQVTHEFKFSELNPLWDMVNSAIQRIPKGDMGGGIGSTAIDPGLAIDDVASAMRIFGAVPGTAVAICDHEQKVREVNEAFETITGIRREGAIGEDIPSVARDQAFGALVPDLFGKAQVGAEPASDDFEFNGVGYKVYATAIGAVGGSIKGYVFVAVKAE